MVTLPRERIRGPKPSGPNDTRVFVVNGRNEKARAAVFAFLRSLGLHPMEWTEVIHSLGRTSPFVGEIVRHGLEVTQAAVIVFTPDEFVQLRPELRIATDPADSAVRSAARANVVLEAGMALAMDESRTVLLTVGDAEIPSDLGGRHLVRMNDSLVARQRFRDRLHTARCRMNPVGEDWHHAGDFDAALPPRIATSDFSPAPAVEANSFTTQEKDILLLMLHGNREAILWDGPPEYLATCGVDLQHAELSGM